MADNKEILFYLIRTQKFYNFPNGYKNYILENVLDVALEFGSKETAAFLIQKEVRPLYKDKQRAKFRDIFGSEPYSYLYKVTLHNILNEQNKLKLYAHHHSSLPAEIIEHIWSYRDKHAAENLNLMLSCRSEVLKARKNNVMVCGAVLAGTALSLGIGIILSPLLTTITSINIAVTYYAYNTEHEVSITKLKALANMGLLLHSFGGINLALTNIISVGVVERFRVFGAELDSNLKLAGTVLTGIVAFMATNSFFSYDYSYLSLGCSLISIFYTGICLNNPDIIISNILQHPFLKAEIDSAKSFVRPTVEIFSDVVHKNYLYIRDTAIAKASNFADMTSRNLENISERLSRT